MKNNSPLLVDRVRGYFDRLPPWIRDVVSFRIEKQKIDAQIAQLDANALESELKQENTDEKLRTSRFLGDGAPGSGNDFSGLPTSHPSEVVLRETGQVADVTESVGVDEVGLVEGPPLQEGSSEQVGEVWVTKKVEAPTFDRAAYEKQIDDLIPQEFRGAIPQETETHVVDGTAAMPTLGPNDQVKREQQQKVGVKEVTVQSRDLSGTLPTLRAQKIDPNFNGATLTLAKDVVAEDATISQPYGTTDTSVVQFSPDHAVKEVWTAGSFPNIKLYTYDQEMNTRVESAVDIVDAGSVYAAAAGVLEYEERKIDAQHKQRIVHTPVAPGTEVTYETRMFTYPALLINLTFQLVSLAAAGRSEVQWTAGIRASFTIPTKFQTNTSWSSTMPTADPVITWAPGDIVFKGASYAVNFSNLLYNAWSNIGVTFTGDTYYGNVVDRFSVSATNPSASGYISWINSQQCISSTVGRYKRWWWKKNTYLTIL